MRAPSVDVMAEHLRTRERERRARAALRAARFTAALPTARDILAQQGAERVWLFGSLASPERFEEHSDVDLAASGLPARRYFDALAALMALFGTSVDLVRTEDAPASLLDRVHAEGREL